MPGWGDISASICPGLWAKGWCSCIRPGLSMGNYNREKPISLLPEQHSEGDEPSIVKTNRVWSAAQTPGFPDSVGKGLAGGSEPRNFQGLVETLFWLLKREQHGSKASMCAWAFTNTKPPNSWEEGRSLHHVTMVTSDPSSKSKWRHFGLWSFVMFHPSNVSLLNCHHIFNERVLALICKLDKEFNFKNCMNRKQKEKALCFQQFSMKSICYILKESHKVMAKVK